MKDEEKGVTEPPMVEVDIPIEANNVVVSVEDLFRVRGRESGL